LYLWKHEKVIHCAVGGAGRIERRRFAALGVRQAKMILLRNRNVYTMSSGLTCRQRLAADTFIIFGFRLSCQYHFPDIVKMV